MNITGSTTVNGGNLAPASKALIHLRGYNILGVIKYDYSGCYLFPGGLSLRFRVSEIGDRV